MKRLIGFAAIIFFSCAAFAGQNQNPPPPTLGPPPGETKPTLGAAPSLGGPTSATVMNPAMLRQVKTIYIGLMDNHLNTDLLNDFAKHGPFRVVPNRNHADAILRGTCFDSMHLREVHSEVFLTDQSGKSIWQDVIHQPYHPPSLSQAVSETANEIIAHLQQSIAAVGHK